tara:strand:- start:1442 stop:1621 length:180 start_codon:yes stop_codon:yes gene_type:complete
MINSSDKEDFIYILRVRNIYLPKEDFDEAYESYKKCRKTYNEILKDNFKDFEPRQRIFD